MIIHSIICWRLLYGTYPCLFLPCRFVISFVLPQKYLYRLFQSHWLFNLVFLLDGSFLQVPDCSSCPRCPPLLRDGPFSPPAHAIVQLTAPAGWSQPWPPCRLGLPRSQSQPALPLAPFLVICLLPPFLCALLSLSHADPCPGLHFSPLFSTPHRLATFSAALSKTVGRLPCPLLRTLWGRLSGTLILCMCVVCSVSVSHCEHWGNVL